MGPGTMQLRIVAGPGAHLDTATLFACARQSKTVGRATLPRSRAFVRGRTNGSAGASPYLVTSCSAAVSRCAPGPAIRQSLRSASHWHTFGQTSFCARPPMASPICPLPRTRISWRSFDPTRLLNGAPCEQGTRSSASAMTFSTGHLMWRRLTRRLPTNMRFWVRRFF